VFATANSIASFLRGVLDRFDQPGIMYLVGESSLVVEGKRSFCSEVIVCADVDSGDKDAFSQAVDEAASSAGLAVTIEHPADVIPLPDGAEGRARTIATFDDDDSSLLVRHFDPYTTAIRFIARGDEPDYDLVVALLEMEWLELEELRECMLGLLPRFSFETIQQDPAEFRRKYKGLTQMWLVRSRAMSDRRKVGV